MGLKSLFIKEELVPVKQVVPVSKVVKTKYVASVVEPEVDTEIRDALLQSMQESKLAGFDYLKFQAALEEASELADDEGKKFKIAVMSAKQLGVNKAKLIESANHYLQVLEEDAKDFAKDLAKKQSSTIGANETKISSIETSINDKQAQIAQLTSECKDLHEQHESLTAEISETKTLLETKKKAFDITYNVLSEEIQENIKKINQYL